MAVERSMTLVQEVREPTNFSTYFYLLSSFDISYGLSYYCIKLFFDLIIIGAHYTRKASNGFKGCAFGEEVVMELH